eukprot:GSMAST32.ASY1.ANO1.664.1 assembled CDS
MYALTAIKGIGRRFSNLILKKAEIDLNKRAGMMSQEEIEKIIPKWFLNKQKDPVTGKWTQLHAQGVAGGLREDIERLKKIRSHRGLRHYWGLTVRGQHTKTTGRKGKSVGKKN